MPQITLTLDSDHLQIVHDLAAENALDHDDALEDDLEDEYDAQQAALDAIATALETALTPAAAPDVRRLGFVIGNERTYRRLLIADFDLADIRAKAAAAAAAGVPEISIDLPDLWEARLIGAYVDEDEQPAAPEGVFLGAEDLETVFAADPNERYRWEELPAEVDELGGVEFLSAPAANWAGVNDLNALNAASARLYINTSTLGISAEVTTWADDDAVQTSTGFLLADIPAKEG